jgi:hypothetical protein
MEFQAMTWEQVQASQQSPKQREFARFSAEFDNKLHSSDPKIVQARAGWINQIQNLAPGEVHIDRALSNFALKYANEEHIGDALIPAIPASAQSDKYHKFDERAMTRAPDLKIPDRGHPNQVDFSTSPDSFLCEDRGLSQPISEAAIMNSDEVLDTLQAVVSSVSDQVSVGRELIAANVLTTAGNYSGNTAALAVPWSNPASDPARDVLGARGSVWPGAGPGRWEAFCSYDVYKNLAVHPALRTLFAGSTLVDNSGLVTPQMLANVFDVAKLHIGKAWKDTANEAQAASYSRIWPDVFGIVRVMQNGSKFNAAFAGRFQWIKPEVSITIDARAGVRGVRHVAVRLSEIEKIIAPKTGYLLTSVI